MKLKQLSLRDLLLLMALAAVSCGWWVDRMRLNQLVDAHRKESEWLQRSLTNLGWVISTLLIGHVNNLAGEICRQADHCGDRGKSDRDDRRRP